MTWDFVGNFMLVLPRIGGIVAVAPVFSGRYPAAVKAGLSAAIAFALAPVIACEFPGGVGLIVTVIAELLVGLAIGYAAVATFSAVQVAGQVLDMEMGFGIVNVIDPQYGTQVPLIGNFLQILTLVLFLAMDGHHMILSALAASYRAVPIGMVVIRPELTGMMVELFCTMFATAIKLALPVAGAMFCTNVALGLVAKSVPQMNVFVIGLPVKILGGVAILSLAMPLYVSVARSLVQDVAASMASIIRILGW